MRCTAFQESIGATTFEIHHVPGADVPEFGPITVPPDHVFLMGDNRDRSLDSRYFGPVPIGKLKGKAFCVLWSRGPDGTQSTRVGQISCLASSAPSPTTKSPITRA